jgi:hypothetical protein
MAKYIDSVVALKPLERSLQYVCYPTPEDTDPVTHFPASVTKLFEYALRDCSDSDMVGITIRNKVNEQVKPVGFRLSRKDHVSRNVIWNVLGSVAQRNARFGAMDRLIIAVHSVKLPFGFGGGRKTKVRQLSVMAHLKRNIIEVKAEQNCLAHALVIAIARVNEDPDYNAYREGRKIRPVADRLFETTDIDLSNGAGLPELSRFQDIFHNYKIVVYVGLNCDSILFEGQVEASKRLNLLYDGVTRHYHVIASQTGAMAKQNVCKACNNGYMKDVTHVCVQICSDCFTYPPCVSAGVRIHCSDCNRNFRSQSQQMLQQLCRSNHTETRV